MNDRRTTPVVSVIGIFALHPKFRAERDLDRVHSLPPSVGSTLVQAPAAVSSSSDRLRRIVLVSELPSQRGRRLRSNGH